MEEILKHVLEKALPETLGFEVERRENSLYLPEVDTIVTPVVAQVNGTNVGLEFHVKVEGWDKYLYEWGTGFGTDVISSASMASYSFSYGLMSGLRRHFACLEPKPVDTEFAGKHHEWAAYCGDIVRIGDQSDDSDIGNIDRYWELLKSEIVKRLGNQKMVYVKIYAAKYYNEVVGECRIDDVDIPELGRIVAKVAEKWPDGKLISDKQFIIIEQNPETFIQSPYEGEEGRKKLENTVVEYLKLFRKSAGSEDLYDRLVEDAKQIMDDPVLASECVYFLPEILATHAVISKFDKKYEISDKVTFNMEDGPHEVCVSQLLDYDMLDKCICGIINKKVFRDDTNELYFELLGCSSITKMIDQVMQKDLRDIKPIKIYYNMGKDFVLR